MLHIIENKRDLIDTFVWSNDGNTMQAYIKFATKLGVVWTGLFLPEDVPAFQEENASRGVDGMLFVDSDLTFDAVDAVDAVDDAYNSQFLEGMIELTLDDIRASERNMERDSIDGLLKDLIETSCKLDDMVGIDSGDRDYLGYTQVTKDDVTNVKDQFDDVEVAAETENFTIYSSPTLQTDLGLLFYNKSGWRYDNE